MGETTTTDACSRHIRAKSQGRPPRMSGSQPTRRNGLPTTISPTTAPVPEPATLRRVPVAPAEAADDEQFHAWRMPFPGHDRRRPTRIEARFTARGRPDSRDVFRAISENDAGRGRVGAPTSAPVSVTDAVSDPATAVCTRRTTPAFVRQRARALRCRHARPGRPAGSADARIGALPAPASVKGSSDALTARIHATRHSRRRAVRSSARCWFRLPALVSHDGRRVLLRAKVSGPRSAPPRDVHCRRAERADRARREA
jgi:hypothetical protein